MRCCECIWWDTSHDYDGRGKICKCMNPNAPGYKMWREWKNHLCKGYGEPIEKTKGEEKMKKAEIAEQLVELKDYIKGAVESSTFIPLSYYRAYNHLIEVLHGGEDPEITEAKNEKADG